MGQFTLENGLKKDLDMGKDCRYGKMGLSTRDTGKMIWLMAKED